VSAVRAVWRWLGGLGLAAALAAGWGVPAPVAAATPTVSVAQLGSLGSVLVGPNGMTLYYYTKDTANVSNCTGACAQAWPPLTVTGAPTAGAGVSGTLGVLTRADGSQQVTYNGWPLYYYVGDQKPGDANGQNVGGVWYVATPTLAAAPGASSSSSSTTSTPSSGAATSGTAASTTSPTTSSSSPAPSSTTSSSAGGSAPSTTGWTLSVAQNAQLGPILVGPNGMTLYRFAKDSLNTSNCSGACSQLWPPLTVTGTPTVGAGLPGTVGVITRADGTRQVTYNGWPLYYYASDQKPGDVNGQGVKGVWFVATPTMAAATAAAPAAAPSSASQSAQKVLPKTGGAPPLEVAGGALLAAAAALLLAGRRRRAA
jgi:LPXTG-motif cell wall-anchored protein